jgi:anti-sigma B factor antagonist
MQIEHRIERDVLVVSVLEKRLDARAAPRFRDKLNELVDAGQRRVVVDLSAVEFVDSSGLGALVALLKQLDGDGGLVICGARETVMSMFKLTRLDKVFQILATADEAVAALAGTVA